VTAALEALQATDIADRAQFVAAIRSAWAKAEALQFTVEAQAARARAERDLHAIDEWREAVHGMTDTLSTASAAVGNAVRMGDPIIAEMVQIRPPPGSSRSLWSAMLDAATQCGQEPAPGWPAARPLARGSRHLHRGLAYPR